MDKISLLFIIIHTLPESLVMILLAVKVLGSSIEERKILFIILGIVEAAIVYLLRSLEISFGVHTIVTMLSIGLWTYILTKKDFIACLFSSVIVMILLILFEFVVTGTCMNVFDISSDTLLGSVWLKIIIGWPQIIMLFLIGIVFNKRSNRQIFIFK